MSQATATLKNQLSELARLSRFVESFGAQHGLSAQTVFELTLALDEVLTNIISYAYEDSRAHDIVVRLMEAKAVEGRHLSVQVEDDGRPFNPLEVRASRTDVPLEARSIGGLGIHLVRKVMEQLEYCRQDGKNVLMMRKTIAETR